MAVATPTVVTLPHPLSAFGRVSTSEQFRAGETLGRFVARVGIPVPHSEYVVLCNGFEVPHASWRGLRPKPGDLINIAAVSRGGGDSKILGTVAMLALALTAPYLAGMAMTGTWAVATGFTGSLLTMGIMIGGSLLISALIPPPKPTDIGTGSKYESSPTYSISGGRNRVRAWEPMTLIFGRHKVVPDAGAQPYVVNSGDDQYLNQVFHFGLQAGAVTLSDYKIGQTPISNYQGVTLQQSDESGALSLFAGNVNTLQGFQLASGVVNQRTTAAAVTYINVDLAATLFSIDNAGNMQPQTVQIVVQYAPAGSGAWVNAASYAISNYATNYWSLQVADTAENGLGQTYQVQRQVSFGSVNQGDHTEGDQVVWKPGHYEGFAGDGVWWVPAVMATWRWVTHPYALGRPWQGIAPDPFLGTSSSAGVQMTGAKQDATKTSVGWSVAPGQYDIRIWKVTADLSDSRNRNDVAVTQILCYQQDTSDYSGQLRVALQIKANAQLNGAVDELSAIATAWAPVWDGSQFTLAQTRNPAWWFLWFAIGKVSGNRVYGAGLTWAQLDIEGIKAWAVFCDSKGLTFDYVLDQGQTCAQVLQMIARAGRASPTWQTGRLGVVWDAADRPVTAMFGPFNIKAGSFRIDYINGDTPDEIVANFADAANDWQMGEVRVKVPGATSTINPMQLDLEGVTDSAVAGREANLLAAAQIWHRRQVTWETDIEGWVAHRGDVVQMSHDLTVWGYSGRVLARNGNTLTLQTKLPTGTGTLMLRDPDGNMRIVPVAGGTDTDQITLPDMAGFALPGDLPDVPAVDWAWFFDPLETPGRRFRVTSVQPSEDGVKFTAVDDASEYYASETDPYAYTPPRDGQLLGGVVFRIDFSERTVSVAADIQEVTIRWSQSAGIADVALTVGGVPRAPVRTDVYSLTLQVATGTAISAAITPINTTGRGTTAANNYTVIGLAAPLGAVTGLNNAFRDGLTTFVWQPVADARPIQYEVRLGSTWDAARLVGVISATEIIAVANGLYWVAARYDFAGRAIYGAPATLSIAGAVLVRNVIESYSEQTAWAGTKSGGAVAWDGMLTLGGASDVLAAADVLAEGDVLWLGGAVSPGVYESPHEVDIGYVAPVRVDFDIAGHAFNFTQDSLSVADIIAIDDILNAADNQKWRAVPQIQIAQDDHVYGAWADSVPGLQNARYFKSRLRLETDVALIVPFVERFDWQIDVPDMIQRAESVAVPIGGMRVNYDKTFHAPPNVQIATLNATAGDTYKLTNGDETGFDLQLFGTGGAKAGLINWLSQGY